MKKKRIMSLVVLLIFASCVILPCSSVHVYAGEIKTTGYWKFARSWDEQTSSLTHSGSNYSETISGSASGGFHDRCEIVADGYRYSYTSLEDRLHEGGCNGEYGEAVFTFSPLPGATLQPGEKLGITASVSCSTSGHHVGVSGQLMIDYTRSLESNSYTYFKTEVDTGNYVIVPEQIEQKEGKRGGSHWDRIGNTSGTYYTIIPSGKKSGDSLYIRFHFNAYETRIDSIYQYEWVDTTPAAAHAEDTGDKDDAEDIGNTDDTGKDDVTVESSVPEEETPVTGETVTTDEAGNIFQTITQFADEATGEDKGAGIITAIIIGVAGALAAAGALSSSSGGNKDGGDDIKRQKTYKMKVYKGFGDSIRKGAKPVTVWARIVEVIEGEDINRPELSEKIIVSGSDMNVKDAGMDNDYRGAEVSIPADSEVQTATLTFTYNGEGGVFRNNIIFKVVGEPEITFPAISEDGTRWDVNNQNNQVDMIAGAGERERLRFVITNASQEPKAIRFKDYDGFKITYEKDPQWQFTYYACIENLTPPIEKESGIFAAMVSTGARVEADFEDGITIWSYISIRLFPEGLAAQGKLTNGRLIVSTLPLENPTEGFAKITPTVFSLTLAYLDGQGHTVVAEEPWWTPKELTDDGKYGLLFKENFKYNTKYQTASEVAFYPDVTLPTLGDPYEVKLHLAVDAGRTGGRDYSADLPMAVFGEEPKRIYADDERKAEMERIKKDIKFFGLAGDPGLSKLLHEAARGECSAGELRNIRNRLLEAAVFFYQEQGDAEKQMADLFSKYIIVAGALVKSCDLAMEWVMNAQWPGYGKITAKFINPFKNMLGSYLGERYNLMEYVAPEYAVSGSSGSEPDIVDVICKSAEDAMASAIGILIVPDESTLATATLTLKRTNAMEELKNAAGYIVATYLMICYVEHYFGYNGKGKKGEKGDVFRSCIAACADLGYEALKDFVLKYIAKYCKALFEKIGQWCGELFKKIFKNQINAAAFKAGQKAFDANIKGKFQDFSNKELGVYYSELSQKTFDAAKTAREAAKDGVHAEVDSALEAFAKWLGEEADGDQKSVILGLTLSYFLGGNGDDGEQPLGSDTKDVLYEALTRYLGVKIGNIYEGGGLLNPFDVTCRVEDGKITLGILGYFVEINIMENIAALCDLLYEALFSWLDALWKATKTAVDTKSIPDRSERVLKSKKEIGYQIGHQMEKINDFKWQYTEYKKKTEYGSETII